MCTWVVIMHEFQKLMLLLTDICGITGLKASNRSKKFIWPKMYGKRSAILKMYRKLFLTFDEYVGNWWPKNIKLIRKKIPSRHFTKNVTFSFCECFSEEFFGCFSNEISQFLYLARKLLSQLFDITN